MNCFPAVKVLPMDVLLWKKGLFWIKPLGIHFFYFMLFASKYFLLAILFINVFQLNVDQTKLLFLNPN